MVDASAKQIAAIARARGPELSELITLYADALADSLAKQLELVAWDREQLVGQIQSRVVDLNRSRPAPRPGPAVRVIERRGQPLESIESVWSWLRRGRTVLLQREPDACTGALDLLRNLETAFAPGVLTIEDELSASLPEGHTEGGVPKPQRRVAVIDSDADRELAAYVLARTGLRRSGVDPRGVKVAYVAGDLELLQRHLRRLWVGVTVGPANDPESFAGPVTPVVRDRFLDAYAQWKAHADVEAWCPGGLLERMGDPRGYLAPALFHTSWPLPDLPLVGPMIVVVGCDEQSLREGVRNTQSDGGQVVQIGGRPGAVNRPVRHVRGALLVERLPPGLPDPRPV
ncbi:MAG: hypothetical protein AAF799_38530 [Myxococcota bacterium]